MTATQDRAVAAMRAIGDTVTGAPPLRLPPRPAAAGSPRLARLAAAVPDLRAWRLWLGPAAAAAAVVALAVSLVLMRSVPRESAASPGTETSAAAIGSSGVPPYYVTLPASHWYSITASTGQLTPTPGRNGLIIGATATGKTLATVLPPRGMTFNVVSGAADDRTFLVGVTSYLPGEKTVSGIWFETWYLLRISPGTAHVARLTRLPVPVLPSVTGVAISPDGTELAVAWQPPDPVGQSAVKPVALAVMSLATGGERLHWGSARGRITPSVPAANTGPGPYDTNGMATALRWTPDGRELAFAWNGAAIRLLDLGRAAPSSSQGDLLRSSSLLAGIGTGETPAGTSLTCVAAHGWALSTGARTFTCAGSVTPARPAAGPGCDKDTPAHPAFVQVISLGRGTQRLTTLARSSSCMASGPRTVGAELGWVSPDGSRVIGTLDVAAPGLDVRYGIFTAKTFSALPVFLPGGLVVDVAW